MNESQERNLLPEEALRLGVINPAVLEDLVDSSEDELDQEFQRGYHEGFDDGEEKGAALELELLLEAYIDELPRMLSSDLGLAKC